MIVFVDDRNRMWSAGVGWSVFVVVFQFVIVGSLRWWFCVACISRRNFFLQYIFYVALRVFFRFETWREVRFQPKWSLGCQNGELTSLIAVIRYHYESIWLFRVSVYCCSLEKQPCCCFVYRHCPLLWFWIDCFSWYIFYVTLRLLFGNARGSRRRILSQRLLPPNAQNW